jgi:hypothetical protein
MSCLSWSTDQSGWLERISAAAPDTSAAAIDVPLMVP